MEHFREIPVSEIKENFFSAVGEDWMLITAKNREGRINTMTASWGCVGVLWAKPVCVCFIRPQRYTLGFVNDSDRLTLSFLEDGHRGALQLCGTKSGRDCDKIKEAGLTAVTEGDIVSFAEARTVLVGRKLYCGEIDPSDFIDRSIIDSKYPERDFHKVFICEIEKVLVKE